jgi:hypothetical protein
VQEQQQTRTTNPKAKKTYIEAAASDAEWWITCGPSVLGERGISEPLLLQLQLGIQPSPSGVPETDLYSDRQVGFGPAHRHRGTVARARRCSLVWHQLSPYDRQILAARYESRQWPPGVAARLGPLVGVIVLEQAGRQAAGRIMRARRMFTSSESEVGALRRRIAERMTADLLEARARLRESASRLLRRHAKLPPWWWQTLASEVDQGAVNRELAAEYEARLAASAEEAACAVSPLEGKARVALRGLAMAESGTQAIITEPDLWSVYDTAQKAAQCSNAGRDAGRRCKAWERTAERRLRRALGWWSAIDVALGLDHHA